MNSLEKKLKKIPNNPGVYLMKDKNNKIIYVGKAVNLKKRVRSYFLGAHNERIEKLISEIYDIKHIATNNALEALILESNLIKKYKPKYNIKEKDDKSFLYVLITDEIYPRVILIRGKELNKYKGKIYGPFTSASSIKQALRIIRKIFPYNLHPEDKIPMSRPCFDCQIGLCPGICVKKITPKEYKKTIKNISLMFSGKTSKIIKNLKKEMKDSALHLEFEKAEKIKKQIFALEHIRDTGLINNSDFAEENNIKNSKKRIEGYDISNISGDWAVGSMVVFSGGEPHKSEYKRFKIKTINQINDLAMLREVLLRRFSHKDWQLPDLIVVDGGENQVNIAKEVLSDFNLRIPVIGIAKGPKRKRNDFYGDIAVVMSIGKDLLVSVRDEAHRFAVKYHRILRSKII